MKLPAVATLACFAGGIALGLNVPFARPITSLSYFLAALLAVLLLTTGLLLVRTDKLLPAALASAFSWVAVGMLAAWVADQPRAPGHVVARIERGEISLQTPLRWHGALRDEPVKLPWGVAYDLDLSGVEYEGRLIPVTGGLRLSFSPGVDGTFPEVHAGDSVTAVAQGKLPQVFRDEGAFDRRAYLASQNIDLVATLRSGELISVQRYGRGFATFLPRLRRRLRDEIDVLFASAPDVAATMRAMLLGDRSFVERSEAEAFQKTGTFHILVVAGLHVGAIAFVLFWIGRRIRMNVLWAALFVLSVLLAYVAVVEQRPPVLRAAIMASVVVIGMVFFRRLELLNSAAVAAILLLVARPLQLRDSSFQLSFLAIGCIGGIAAPWLERTAQPYARALRGWRDVTRDAAHEPLAAQFRIDLRSAASWMAARFPLRIITPFQDTAMRGLAFGLRIWELLIVSSVLQFGMLPLMARDFHRVTLSGPLVNLVVVPLTGILVPLGFLTLIAGLGLPMAGKALALASSWIAGILLHFVRWFAGLPRWSYRIPAPPWLLLAAFLAAAAALAVALRFDIRAAAWLRRVLGISLLAGVIVIATYPFAPKTQQGKLEVTVLDVGQGDSLFVVSPRGHTLLIDGGGAFRGFPGHEERNSTDPGEDAVSPYLWSRGFQRLDVVALTHAHQDHLGGLTAVLQNFSVGRLWIGREVHSAALSNLEELARSKGVLIEREWRAQKFAWDGANGEFLWPESKVDEVAASATNNDSLVLRLAFGSERILLPGDAERQAERSLLAENPADNLRADVLKVGHHGSKNSSTPQFLATVQPSIAIISAGADNPYGHPSAELLERLANAGVRVLRTDRDGAVHVLTDGHTLEISCFIPCMNIPSSPEGQAHVTSGEENPQQ